MRYTPRPGQPIAPFARAPEGYKTNQTSPESSYMGFSHPILANNSFLFSASINLRRPVVTLGLGLVIVDSPVNPLLNSLPPPTQTFRSVTFTGRLFFSTPTSSPSASTSPSSSLRVSSAFPPIMILVMTLRIIPNHIKLSVCSSSNMPRKMYFTSVFKHITPSRS